MSFKFEILENEDKNTLVLSSDKEIYNTRVVFNDDSKSEQFPLVKQLFFLPFVKSITLDKHLILIEKLDFLDWKDVQEEVIDQIEKFLNDGGLIYQVNNPVTIYAESTPNPNVIKFVANKKLVNIAHEFKTSESANYCFIAKALFNHDFIKEIYIDFNFISVTINEKFTWDEFTMQIREFILSYIKDGNQIIDSSYDVQNSTSEGIDQSNMDEISKKISALIDEQIKPAVASDGGNILFQSYDNESMEVKVILQGACSGCPSSTYTLKNGIETMLKDFLPGKISNVVAING
ncbi:MAG: NifU N-terminal domain-containing protein [Flavobacteriaceae bacterium]|tara:strand:- start:264 stop:1136 length:873 start_codon:yes stop_codon:yes gene_type:complete